MRNLHPGEKLSKGRFRAASFVLTLLGGALSVAASPSCTTGSTPETPAIVSKLKPGDVCDQPSPSIISLRFEPHRIFLASCKDGANCAKRTPKLISDPDFCTPTPVRFESSSADIVAAPAPNSFDLYKTGLDISVAAGKTAGSATIKAFVAKGDGTEAETTLEVEVLEVDVAANTDIACDGTASMQGLSGGKTLAAMGGLAGASIGLPAGAEKPNSGSYLWSVPAFDAEIACSDEKPPSGFVALGPAVTFGPVASRFQRDIPLSIPLNPARLPEAARMRHVAVSYSGPKFKTPRIVPVADARVEEVGGHWALTFKAPMLGTYQAVFAEDAGTKEFPRKLTHRAVIGVSMGGGGTAMFGTRHHDLFDVLAPLGGPVDWTWMLQSIERSVMGGFRPIPKGTVLADIKLDQTACATNADCEADETCMGALMGGAIKGQCALLSAPVDPYEHTQVFNHWWYEYPRNGNGGNFNRTDYIQIFRDLSIMFGNPNGENLAVGGENLPAGVPPNDPSQTGGRANDECSVPLDPIDDDPNKPKQEEIAKNCPAERCANTLTMQNYFDREYNPDGTFPVITVCDGAPQNEALTPYSNTWTPNGNQFPLELALAVDYNGNGVRDAMEPVITAGREPWSDVGVDGKADKDEPGYVAGANEDPAGDNYDAQYNPSGTEKDARYQMGEPFEDVGLDGVAGTKQQPAGGWTKAGDGYDVGEGDGKFTTSSGLARFWERDAHSIVRQWSKNVPSGPLDDAALRRLDVWTDGGTRDLFNFGVDAQHLAGTFVARGRPVGYYSDFAQQPELDPSNPNAFFPGRVPYEDVPGIVLQRYGKIDPTAADVESGSGQHVGTANEVIARLQGALYFIGSRWPEKELRSYVLESGDDPAEGAKDCEVSGGCAFEFKSPTTGRVGKVGVSLPPGYAHKLQQDRHYPVIYLLHGYGQEPQDLIAATAILRTWMNAPSDGMESRLPKAILVYVDGRCRVGPDGKSECIRGTFFGESPMPSGAKLESWWLDLMAYVEQNYRTMGETETMWTE